MLNFLLDEKPKEDQLRCFDVIYSQKAPTLADPNRQVKTEGRFTYDAHPKEGGASSVLKGKEIIKTNPGKFEIQQFPKQAEPAQQLSDQEGQEALIKAKVDFSMAMAIQVLATLDSPPTKEKPLCIRGVSGKEEEVQYLWTALAILGEQNPKMKFSPDAIVVRGTANFNPNNERGRFYGFAADSLKARVFDHLASVKNQTQELAELTKKRLDTSDRKTADKHTQEATNIYKEKLKNGRDIQNQIEKAEKRVEAEEKLTRKQPKI